MPHVTAEFLKKSSKRRYKTVEVPDVGAFRVANLSAAAVLKIRGLQVRRERGEDVDAAFTSAVLVGGCVDDGGQPLFTDESVLAFLDAYDFETLDPLLLTITELTKAPRGNSVGSPSGASPSVSP